MANRNKVIEQQLRQLLIRKGITGHAAVPLYIIFGLPLMIYEEHVLAGYVGRHTAEMAILKQGEWPEKVKPNYEALTSFQQLAVRNFYDVYKKHHLQKMMILSIENSIMLCFQTTLLVFNFLQPPLRELDYQTKSVASFDGLPTAKWICLNILLGLIKIAMSGYSTFSLLTIHENLRSYFHYHQPAGILTHLGTVTKAIIQIVAGTGYIFLSGYKLPSSFTAKAFARSSSLSYSDYNRAKH